MYILGYDFKPANIHAGGLRYHGAGVIVSQLLKDDYMYGMDIPQLESFEAGTLFSRTEGIIPAPESYHAIAAAFEKQRRQRKLEKKMLFYSVSQDMDSLI